MQYTLTEVAEIPADGRSNRVPAGFYNDIIKVFKENQYPMAKVEVPGRNPDTVARRLEIHVPARTGVICRGDGVYLINYDLVNRE